MDVAAKTINGLKATPRFGWVREMERKDHVSGQVYSKEMVEARPGQDGAREVLVGVDFVDVPENFDLSVLDRLAEDVRLLLSGSSPSTWQALPERVEVGGFPADLLAS